MNGILHRMVDHALSLIDALDDLVAEAALGFGAAAPIIVDLNGGAPSEPHQIGN